MTSNHKSKILFITGIPTSGKTFLAQKLSEKTGAIVVNLDNLRIELSKNETYKKWIDFYFNQNEEEYLTKTSPEKRWQDLIEQSEGLWPAFKNEINKYKNEEKPVIFECVNLLPHIVKKDFDFPLVVLVTDNREIILERIKNNPRWGDTEYLQELEAKNFFDVERINYKIEAEKFNCPVFESTNKAFDYLIKVL